MKSCLILFFTAALFVAFGQTENGVWLHPNQGQWDEPIEYMVQAAGGRVYVEGEGMTYHFYENSKSRDHANHEKEAVQEEEATKHHVVRVSFEGANWQGEREELDASSFYRNYFLGNDLNTHQSKVYSTSNVHLKEVYSGIDVAWETVNNQLKYSFVVQSGISPSTIQLHYEGQDKLHVDKNGNLIVETSLGVVEEQELKAWTVSENGRKTAVAVHFVADGNSVSFAFPEGYAENEKLIIDPTLVFSTFSGSTADNWGMSATPGPNGEAYGAGICFGVGYPTTTGAFDTSYNGGTSNGSIDGFDVAISKFTSDGTGLLYATYIGGSRNELPESTISSNDGSLYVLGISASLDFPTTPGAFQQTQNGGSSAVENSLPFESSDLFVLKLSEDGNVLENSTFVGGSGNDGLNTGALHYNYGDQFRGELILDAQENVYVASNTMSSDFPVTNASTLNGAQDMIIFKLNNAFSSLDWATYFGGGGDETANSITLTGDDNTIYVAGGSNSPGLNLNGDVGTHQGQTDGILLKLNASDGQLTDGTFMGGIEYDQTYFVRVDIDNFPYVFGQTETDVPISSGTYGVASSGQFLAKYEIDLSSRIWSTSFGAGTGHPEISPTAFMISDCYDIFLTGWGGSVNSGGSSANWSNTNGFPITSDAYQSNTNGSNFYLAILGQDASDLIYGTYMGGTSSSANHVDGGTSRFDKSGTVYHAVCGSCGASTTGFTTTLGVWSETDQSEDGRCNLAVFKFQLGMPYSLSPDGEICEGDSYQLSASGGINYAWTPEESLDDPTISNPVATPNSTTTYYVEMNFNEGCAIEDSVIVEIIEPPTADITDVATICLGETISLTASSTGGDSYQWTPDIEISTTNEQTVDIWPSESRYYYCTVENTCFETVDSVFVEVNPGPNVQFLSDTIICQGDSIRLEASNAQTYIFPPQDFSTQVSLNELEVFPAITQPYFVEGYDEQGCMGTDTVLVELYEVPILQTSPDTTICLDDPTEINATGADAYSWTPSSEITSGENTANPIVSPSVPTNFIVEGEYGMGCKVYDSVFIDLRYYPNPSPMSLTVCENFSVDIDVTTDSTDSYAWSPGTYLNTTTGSTVTSTPEQDITYTVSYTNICGTVTAPVEVEVIYPDIEAFGDTIICPYESTELYAVGGISYSWSPNSTLNNAVNSAVTATPTETTNYVVQGTDEYGCVDTASVLVELFPLAFIQTSPDAYLLEGDTAQLSATSTTEGPYIWSPSEYLSCVVCENPTAAPPGNFTYTVSYTDENGCSASDIVNIYFDPLIYVPNTFTPNGSASSLKINDIFKAVGGNVRDFEMEIYNRWGELIHTVKGIENGWDGTYRGVPCQDGTYVWKAKYLDLEGNKHKMVGHVNLLR